MARDSFGKGLGEGKIVMLGDNRYGLVEEYDPAVKERTLAYYKAGDAFSREQIKVTKDPNLQVVKTTKWQLLLRFFNVVQDEGRS